MRFSGEVEIFLLYVWLNFWIVDFLFRGYSWLLFLLVSGVDEIFFLYVLVSVWIVVFVWVIRFWVGVCSFEKFLWWVIFWISVSMCCRKVVLVVCIILFLRILKLIEGCWSFFGVVLCWVIVFCGLFIDVGVFFIIGFLSLFDMFEIGFIGFNCILGFCDKDNELGLLEGMMVVWLVGLLLIWGFGVGFLLIELLLLFFLGLCIVVRFLLIFLFGLFWVLIFVVGLFKICGLELIFGFLYVLVLVGVFNEGLLKLFIVFFRKLDILFWGLVVVWMWVFWMNSGWFIVIVFLVCEFFWNVFG